MDKLDYLLFINNINNNYIIYFNNNIKFNNLI